MNQVARILDRTGWSQPRLAAHVGVSQQTISRWLTEGRVANRAAQRILDQLESDLAAGRIAPAGAPSLPADPAGGPAAAVSAGPSSSPAPDAQFSGFCSAHGSD